MGTKKSRFYKAYLLNWNCNVKFRNIIKQKKLYVVSPKNINEIKYIINSNLKKMKKILSIAILLFASSSIFAQTQQEEIDYYQSIFGMEKKLVVAAFLELEEDDAFWPIYDEYEKARKELGKKRIKLIVDYADNYDNLTDEKTDELVKTNQDVRKSTTNLLNKYYKKVKKVSGSRTAAQFYQIENYFVVAITAQIYSTIPLIGELE
ncbi:hypothetical protein N9164_09955 [Draconibacterium sp.]|nr:hypothetical protein [Draconibacterium sp.]